MAGLTISLRSPDLKKFGITLKRAPKLLDKSISKNMQTSVKMTKTGWRSVAAVATGRYRNTLKQGIRHLASKTILQGGVRSFTRSAKGFPYPRALEDSVRYHYRSTSRRGQRTAGQVIKMFKRIKPTVIRLFKAGNDAVIKSLKVK